MTAQTKADDKNALYRDLLAKARQALANAWCPHSDYAVGAALLTRSGQIFTGCNVENNNFAGTICAERTAFVKAVSEGHREFEAVAVACKKTFDCWPCGLCRQFMSEFGVDLLVVVEGADRTIKTRLLDELLPGAAKPETQAGA
jgi:cytidine deaminase